MKILFLTLFCAGVLTLAAQEDPDSRFTPVTVADLSVKSYPIDTSAPAVVLAEYGITRIAGTNDGGFAIECKIRRRIHVLKNKAFDKGTISVDVYTDGESQEKISNLKATTYLSDGGKVTELKLNTKSDVYTDKISRNLVRKKFTLPGLKVGAIIEYEYTLTSEFLFNLQPWYFQGDIPCLWSEYRAALPQFLNYMMLQQGTIPFSVEENEEKLGAYQVSFMKEVYAGKTVSERVEITCIIAYNRWVIKNVPAFNEEAYTSSAENYVSKIQFQLAGFQKPLMEKSILASWPEYTASMLKSLDFINEMENTGEWWPADMKQVLKGATTETDIARAIYAYIGRQFSSSGDNLAGKRAALKKVVASKAGNNVELNLLLIAMLRYSGLKADPVMLSTREHGFSTETYPVIGQLNYLVCRVRADEDDWFLDASHPFLGFGKLIPACYNGQARVLNSEATLIHLTADQLTEADQVNVNLIIRNDQGPRWLGQVDHRYGYYASGELRERISKEGLDGLKKELAGNEVENGEIDSLVAVPLEKTDEQLTLKYRIGNKVSNEGVIYLNPVLVPHLKQNPFKSADRKYPVELPYKISQRYIINIDVPEGYSIDELPAPLMIQSGGKNEAVFEYNSSVTGGKITISYSLEIAKTVFKPEEYNTLRIFFTKMVAKLDEQLVIKKK